MPTHTFGEQLSSVSGCFRGYAMQNSWTLWLHCMSGVSIKLCWLVLDLDWPIQEYHGHHEHEDQAGINGEGEEKYEHREETRIAGRLGNSVFYLFSASPLRNQPLEHEGSWETGQGIVFCQTSGDGLQVQQPAQRWLSI